MRIAIACLLLLTSPCHAALIAHWKLQDDAASTTIVATVGSNGTLNSAGNTSASTAGGPGTLLTKSIAFDGTNDNISVSIAMDGSSPYTVCMWVRGDGASGTGSVNRLWEDNQSHSGLIWNHTNASFNGTAYRFPDSFKVAKFGTLNGTTWYHLAVVWNGSTLRTYQDGVLVTTTTGATTNGTTTTSARIGSYNDGTQNFAGRIADVRVYDSDESANLATIMAEADAADPVSITTSATQSLEESERDVVTVAATDGTTPYVWSITGGADQALFAINSSTGALTMPGSADYENPEDADTNNVYVVEVTCTDDDSATDALTINVTVTDEGGAGTGFSAGVNNGPIR